MFQSKKTATPAVNKNPLPIINTRSSGTKFRRTYEESADEEEEDEVEKGKRKERSDHESERRRKGCGVKRRLRKKMRQLNS